MDILETTIKNLSENNQKKTGANLTVVKRRLAKQFRVRCPRNVELLKTYHKLVRDGSIKQSQKIEDLLRKRKVRSLSGIAVVSVLTKPYPCPGNCLYCPTQTGIPKSYLDNEPAVMRAVLAKFDPYLQVETRLESLRATGHPTDKIELIVIGGTWSFLPKSYQNWFIKRCFEACNDNSKGKKQKSKEKKQNLLRAQKRNEKARHRIIGLTIETRPDYMGKEEVKRLRKLGVTRVEMGVQSVFNDVLKKNKRGHDVGSIIEATRLLKDAGFKVCYHMMPNLPGSSLKKDIDMFRIIFNNPDFRPDLLKIYPCAVLKEAPLYKIWKQGRYKPYKDEDLINLLKEVKRIVPRYVRIQRLVRDIPSYSIAAGPAKISNLRQVVVEEMGKEGWKCHCIRCREVRENYNPKEKLVLFREDYLASDGKEIFLSYENESRKKLYSLLRLRIPSGEALFSALRSAAIIRELHTYGQMQTLENSSFISPQHKGLGRKLVMEAEKITRKEFNLKKIAVISGIGARDYYKTQLDYKLEDTYMTKILK